MLWKRLADGGLRGFKFRRQHVIDRFIVDFYCSAARLVVEVDGPIHDSHRERDLARQARLEAIGMRVLRFTNDQVLGAIDDVVTTITHALPPGDPSKRDP